MFKGMEKLTIAERNLSKHLTEQKDLKGLLLLVAYLKELEDELLIMRKIK